MLEAKLVNHVEAEVKDIQILEKICENVEHLKKEVVNISNDIAHV